MMNRQLMDKRHLLEILEDIKKDLTFYMAKIELYEKEIKREINR